MSVKSFFTALFDIILPSSCICCGEQVGSGSGICQDCFNNINFISSPYCMKCGHPFDNVSSDKELLCANCIKSISSPIRLGRSSFQYNDASKNMLLAFKFMDKTQNAKMLSHWMHVSGKDIFNEGIDIIIPVPLHYVRMLKRKYNQSALLAKELGRLSGVLVDCSSVVRVKNTLPQVSFSGSARVRNIKGAFKVKHPKRIKGKRILLIDDVYTTGSTINECAIELLKAGAKSVDYLTASRTV